MRSTKVEHSARSSVPPMIDVYAAIELKIDQVGVVGQWPLLQFVARATMDRDHTPLGKEALAFDVGSLLADTAFARPIKSAETCCRFGIGGLSLAIPGEVEPREAFDAQIQRGILLPTIIGCGKFPVACANQSPDQSTSRKIWPRTVSSFSEGSSHPLPGTAMKEVDL
jgi:hypothetical protein